MPDDDLPHRAADIAALFYEGILAPRSWYAALDRLRHEVRGVSFHQITLAPQDRAVIDSVACDIIPEGKAQEYEQQYTPHDERVAVIAALGDGQFLFDHLHFDARHMSRSAIYADFLRPLGMRHTLGMVLQRSAHGHDYLAVLRASDQPAYGAREQALMELLAPHMARAGRLRAQARQLQGLAHAGTAALDALPQGITVTDGHGRIGYANLQAQRQVREARWLHAPHGRLRLQDTAVQQHFEHALARACQPPHQASVLHAAQGLAAIVRILPLPAEHALASSWTRMALVITSTPFQAGALSPGQLAELLGATPKEAALAQALAQGHTLADFAAMQGCSIHTARDHLKNLQAKTGCRRQIDLVQLVQALG